MKVRAKFKVDRIEATQQRVRINPDGSWDEANMKTVELRTVIMSAVGSNSPENKVFWAFTPAGSINLGTINPEAWKQFELGMEVYVDFDPADRLESPEEKAKRIASKLM